MDTGEIIRLTISENAIFAISYMSATTLALAIIIIVNTQKKNKYMRLKKQTLNLFKLHTREWEQSEDDFTKQLWDDNERLEKEVKVLTNKLSKLSLWSVIMASVLIIPYYINQKFKNIKSE